MATWKKVIVSGSNAVLNQVNVGATQQITSTNELTTTYLTGSFTGSFKGTAILPALTGSTGIDAFIYSGSAPAQVRVSGSNTLTADTVTKWTGNAFANTTITDDGTTVTVAASSSVFNGSVTITENLTVNGTASFINTEDLLIKDRFITLNSGSNSLTDSGIIFQSNSAATGSGPALFLEASSTGPYGRMAMAKTVQNGDLTATPDAYVAFAQVDTVDPTIAPETAPIFGGSSNGYGTIQIDSSTGDIYIYS
jgi:hypothetical protein